MSKFKVGDKVKCISRDHHKNGCGSRLDNSYGIGAILNIQYVFDDNTVGIRNERWVDDERNFELVSTIQSNNPCAEIALSSEFNPLSIRPKPHKDCNCPFSPNLGPIAHVQNCSNYKLKEWS